MNLHSTLAEIYDFLSVNPDVLQLLQDGAAAGHLEFQIGTINFCIYHQINDTFVARILYDTTRFASSEQEIEAFEFCDRVTAAVNCLCHELQKASHS